MARKITGIAPEGERPGRRVSAGIDKDLVVINFEYPSIRRIGKRSLPYGAAIVRTGKRCNQVGTSIESAIVLRDILNLLFPPEVPSDEA